MKQLQDKCFIELSQIECAEIVNDLDLAKKYCEEHDLHSPRRSVCEYIRKFECFYKPITIKEEIDRN